MGFYIHHSNFMIVLQNRNQFADYACNNTCFFLLPPQPETHRAHSAPNGVCRRMGSNVFRKRRKSCRMSSVEPPNGLGSPLDGLETHRMGSNRVSPFSAEWCRICLLSHFGLPTETIRKVSPFGTPNRKGRASEDTILGCSRKPEKK